MFETIRVAGFGYNVSRSHVKTLNGNIRVFL